VVTPEEGRRLGEELGFPYVETSASSGVNVDEVFETLLHLVMARIHDMSFKTDTRGSVPGVQIEKGKGCGC
jgi:GTPase SAR1 family protein